MSAKDGKHVIAVDLDGTLAKWSPDKYDPAVIGAPIKPMVDRVKKMIAAGNEVVIFTARVGEPGAFPHIHRWLRENGLPELRITNRKESEMEVFYDDRAVAVERNTGKILGGEEAGESWEDEARKAVT